MELKKNYSTFCLSGIVRANEGWRGGTTGDLSILADDNIEYKIIPDEVSRSLCTESRNYLEVECMLIDQLVGGPWVKIVSFCKKNTESKYVNGICEEFNSKEYLPFYADKTAIERVVEATPRYQTQKAL